MFRFPSPLDIAAIDQVLSLRPLILVDIGAAGDIDPLLRRHDDPKRVIYFAFEPNPQEFDKIKKRPNARYFRYAISDENGESDFFVDGTTSSLVIQRNSSVPSIRTPVRSLDRLIDEGVLPGPDAVKVDAEGHDLVALRGIGHRLATDVLMVKCEFSFRPHLAGSYFAEIDKLLTTSGLVLFGMQYNCSPVGEFNGGDAVYLRSIESIIRSNVDAHVKRERVLRLIALCHYVRNLDYAFVAARMAREYGLFSRLEGDDIESALQGSFHLPSIHRGGEWTDPIMQLGFACLSVLAGNRWRNKSLPKPNRIDRSGLLSLPAPWFWRERLRQRLEQIYRTYGMQMTMRDEAASAPAGGAKGSAQSPPMAADPGKRVPQ